MIQMVNNELGVDIILRCPHCESSDIVGINVGTEEDSDGKYDNWRIVCNKCGRETLDMDSFEDAWWAFNHDDDTVIQPNKEA